MTTMHDGSVEETGRALRQRSALPPYRPRPQLTSSDRGKANAELRRQRELEANAVFAEANDLIAHVKTAPSSSFYGEAAAQEDAAMEEEVNEMLSVDQIGQAASDGQSSSQVETSEVVLLSKALPLLSPSDKEVSPPATKKARTIDEDEFDDIDDDAFFEQLVATDAIDWENGSSRVTSSSRNDNDNEQEEGEYGYDLVRKLREKHPETQGFVWSSEKQVKVAAKALERGRKVIERIKKEVDREDVSIVGSEASSSAPSPAPRPPTPARPILAPIPSSNLNRSLGSTSRMPGSILTIQEGKRKLQEEAETTQSPLPPIRPSSSLLGTPDRRLPSVRPTGSPLAQTPNPARSTLRLGTTLRTTTPLHSTPSTSTPSKASTSIPRTPRISLGMTPRRAVSGSVPKFKTPFKDASLRQGTPSIDQRSPDSFKIPPVNRGVSSPCVMGAASAKKPAPQHSSPVRRSVFDLSKNTIDRHSLVSMCKAPESASHDDVNEYLSMEVFDAIVQILRQPKRGLKYAFGVNEDYIGREGVLVTLKQAVGTDVEIQREWIDNHYVLILWKLAAYTRHVLDERYWHWEEVCRQFRYRYEREFSCMHKSALKRILRDDTPSTRPMVLCVFEIPPFDEKLGPEQTIILTDGWYKIQAVVDRVLCLAIYGKRYQEENAKKPFKPANRQKQKPDPKEKADFTVASSASKVQEKDKEENEEEAEEEIVCLPYLTELDMRRVKVGTKLAIQGASLESNCEGVDPLKALDRARIRIGGNTARLAKWDAKLGFSRGSFISTIRSLSAGGGKVPLMDIIITRLYPIAFTGVECCPGYEQESTGYMAEWGEAEENERRATWDKHREKTLEDLQQEQEEELQDMRKICEELEQAYEGLSYDDSLENAIDASSCQDMLHAIITAGSARGYLGMTQLIPKLRELAFKKLKEVRERLESETESTLQTRLGTRKVRSFRFVRFRDAIPQDHGRSGSVSSKREKCQRDSLLRIWDYTERIEAGHAVVQSVGDHFMVSVLTADLSMALLTARLLIIQVTSLMPTKPGEWPKADAYGDVGLSSGQASIWRLIKRAAKAE
jgi:hypothetical protein